MTRKRYIKLKMAEGLSRNEAEQNAKEIAEEGCSYQADYEFDKNADRILAELLGAPPTELQEAIGQFTEAVGAFVKEAFPIILTAAETVCEAIADAIDRIDRSKLKQLIEERGEQNERSDQ